jgi:hypothetical protein
MRQIITYALRDGRVTKSIKTVSAASIVDTVPPYPMHENLRRGYYDIECRQERKWPSKFSKEFIKRAIEREKARKERE